VPASRKVRKQRCRVRLTSLRHTGMYQRSSPRILYP